MSDFLLWLLLAIGILVGLFGFGLIYLGTEYETQEDRLPNKVSGLS